MAEFFPLAFAVEYVRPPWAHRVVLGMTRRGERALRFYSWSQTRQLHEANASPWHGYWELQQPFMGHGGTPVIAVWVNWRGDNARLERHLFYSTAVSAYLLWQFRAITNEPFWPGHAEVYGYVWGSITLRPLEDILVLDAFGEGDELNEVDWVMWF